MRETGVQGVPRCLGALPAPAAAQPLVTHVTHDKLCHIQILTVPCIVKLLITKEVLVLRTLHTLSPLPAAAVYYIEVF